MGNVDNVYQDVGFPHLIQCRFKRFDQAVRKLADEANGVGEQERQILEYDLSDGSIQGGKKLVFRKNIRFAEQVHQS